MENRKLIIFCFLGLFFWFLGVIFSFFLFLSDPVTTSSFKSSIDYFNFHFNFNLFLKIFINNILVGFTVSVIGYATGGILTAIIFVYNGFLLGIIMREALFTMTKSDLMYLLLIHGPFEILSFLYLGTIGFRGWEFYKKFFFLDIDFDKIELPSIRIFLFPFIGLLFSAIIEASI